MATQDKDQIKNTLDVLLKQYELCFLDKRNLESMLWQTPAISIAIVAVLVASVISAKLTASTTIGNLLIHETVLGFALGVSLVGMVELRKHRLFCDVRTSDIRMIAEQIQAISLQVYPIRNTTPEVMNAPSILYPDVKKGRLAGLRAYNWLFGFMIVIIIGLALAMVIVAILDFFPMLLQENLNG